MNIGHTTTTFELHHNLATGKYAWFLADMVIGSEWWMASQWFDSDEEARRWSSVDYLRRRDEHIKSVLKQYRHT